MMGLFGGASFYDTLCATTLLPLIFSARARELTFPEGRTGRCLVVFVDCYCGDDGDDSQIFPNTSRSMNLVCPLCQMNLDLFGLVNKTWLYFQLIHRLGPT